MASLTFARIIDPVCSCGEYISRYQPEIEARLIEKNNFGTLNITTDDTDIVQILDNMKIFRMCCRKTILLSPVCRLLKTKAPFNIYSADKGNISLSIERLIIGNPNPKI